MLWKTKVKKSLKMEFVWALFSEECARGYSEIREANFLKSSEAVISRVL